MEVCVYSQEMGEKTVLSFANADLQSSEEGMKNAQMIAEKGCG